MKFLISCLFMIVHLALVAQISTPEFRKQVTGSYEVSFSKAIRFNIVDKDSMLYLHVVGQGQVPIRLKGDSVFIPDVVKPKAEISFNKDPDGTVSSFRWKQYQGDLSLTRAPADSTLEPDTARSAFTGRYLLTGSSLPLFVRENPDGSLRTVFFGETPLRLEKTSANRFRFRKNDFEVELEFLGMANGTYQKIKQYRKGALTFIRVGSGNDQLSTQDGFKADYYKTIPGSSTKFTRTDSLQGTLTGMRTCFDVRFYHLDIKLDPVRRFLSGSNLISFRVQDNFKRMQVDLFRNMKILGITWGNQNLEFTREQNAVFIDFPVMLQKGALETIKIEYEGYPQPADISSTSGGFLWAQDRNGHDWIQVVTQGTGASLWWPCKDHLSDEPDSMRISVTLPKGMKNISNGQRRGETIIGDTAVRSEWFVSYPINTYNVTLNIGDYRELTDQYIDGKDTLQLRFCYLPYNRQHADTLMADLKLMLVYYTKFSGFYPFRRDGLTVMESLYPMEHQGAVSIGSINEPVYRAAANLKALRSMLWHEAGHEWWGNNVSVSDNADIWFHEAFTTYLEIMGHEVLNGKAQALKKLFNDIPSNTEKMVGEYGVNHFKLNSVYSKGALMVHTLRNIINDDTVFLRLLRGMQHELALQTVNSDIIIKYISNFTKIPLESFFNQYLYYPSIPELEMQLVRNANGNTLRYRWKANVVEFRMPVRLMLTGSKSLFLHATDKWQEQEVGDMLLKDFRIDKEHFYVNPR